MNHNHNNNSENRHDSHNHNKPKIEEINRRLNSEGKYKIDHGSHGGNRLVSIRRDEYNGHKIIITTTYEIEVDGKKFYPPIHVSNNGSVATHALPNYASNSAMDLVKTLIDCFPENFEAKGGQIR
jgi:hypothetical protein